MFGKQAMTPAMRKCIRETDAPVSFSTGGGARPGNHTVGFEGSSIIGDEQVYVLDSCPPAQSIGKAVIDGGFMFIWDPRNQVPYMVKPKDVHRCKLKVPRDARVNATRVVEYVPQYDEHVTPRVANEPRKTIPLEAQAASSVPLIEEDAVSFSDGVPVAWNREEVPVSLLKPQKATQYRKDTSSSDVRPKGAPKASPGIASKTEILAPMNATSDVFKFDEQGNLYKLYHEASPSSSFLPSEYEKADDIRQRHKGFTRCLDPHAIGDQAWHHPVRTVRERSRPPISTQPQKYDISTARRSPAAERVAGHAAPTEDRKRPPVAAPAEASSSSAAPPVDPAPKSPVEAESSSVPRGAEGAGEAAPKHHDMDDKLLVELGEGVPFKEDALKAEAISPEHLRTHFPKNPFCRICNISKNTSMRVARKPDGRADDGIDVPTQPMQQLATDDIILAMGTDHPGVGVGGVKVHHVIRDVYSGARIAYPITKRDIATHAKNLRHFLGIRTSDKVPHVLVKHDEAQELEQACVEVGLVPETSLPNRWPHNAKLERDIREEKECTRAIHLQSGLPYSFHTFSFPFACFSLSFDRVDEETGKTQWEMLTRAPFLGRRLCFGQLCYYRKKTPTKRTLEPNMSPALFLGWRVDSGGRYRNVVKVLDYQDFRIRGLSQSIDVPEPELYVEDGPPVFPVAHARDQALLEGKPARFDDEVPSLPEIDLKEVPFPPEGEGIAAPPTPSAKKPRGVYITVERMIRFKETPGCKGCSGDSTVHTPACRARFTKLVEEEKEEARKKFEEKALAEVFSEEPHPAAPAEEEETPEVELFKPEPAVPVGHEYEPSSEEEGGPPEGAGPAAPASPVMLESSSASANAPLPTFGCPAQPAEGTPQQKASRPWKVGNRRARRAAKRGADNFFRKGKVPTMYEFACSPESMMGYVNSLYDIPHVRLCKEMYDLDSCPPAQSIGKAVIDGGFMFIWDPRNQVPYMVKPKDVHRCKLKVPRDARVNATRVVEYVPQYDEHVTPRVANEPRKTIPLEAQAASSVPLIEEDAVSFSDGVPVAWNREEVPVSLLKPQKATQYRKDTSSSDVRPKGAPKASPGIASKTEILAPMNATSDVFKFDEQGNLYKLYHEASPSSSFLPSEYEKADDIRQRHKGFTRCLDPHAIGDQAWHHPVRTVRERSRPPISTQPQKYDISTARRSPAAERVAGHAAPTEDRKRPPVAAPAEASSSSAAPPVDPAPKSPVEAESSSVPRGAEGAGEAAPKHHDMDDKLLVELGEGVPFKEDALKAEAISPEHLRTHFPKNPFCRICNISKNTSMRVARKPDGRADDGIDVPTQPMQQLATDDIILAMGTDHPGVGVGGVKVHHVIRDVYSGARIAYPITKRDIATHAKNLRHFLGIRTSDKVPHVLVKHDEAQELEQACVEVGLVPETSLPNRWPHNAKLERDIREEKECTRAIHLQSGLPYSFHTFSFPFACFSLSFDRVDEETGKTQWEMLTRAPFLGRRLCFGQLCYYRKKTPTKRTLEPNMSPALFLGWRVDSGGRYRNVVKVLDYQDFRIRGLSQSIDVPEPELYVEDGPPVFPVAHARDQALLEGKPARFDDEVPSLPEIDLKEVPFPPEGEGIAAPPTPSAKKPRGVYITVERMIRFKETPGCKGCSGDSTVHTPACRARFTKLVEEEKEEARKKFEEKALAEVFSEEPHPAAPAEEEETPEVELFKPEPAVPVGHEYEPSSEEEGGPPEGAGPAAPASPVMLESSSASANAPLPTFGCPAQPAEGTPQQKASRPWKVGNRRARRAAKRGADNFFRKGKVPTMYEFACSPESMMGYVNSLYDIPHVRLCKEMYDLEDPDTISQVTSQLKCGGPANLWGAIPCTTGSPWQRLNLFRGGAQFRKKWKKQVKESKRLFAGFAEAAEVILLDEKGDVTFEWPTHCEGWNRDDVKTFFEKHRDKFKEVRFDGCAVGVKDRKGNPIRKPWKLMTTSQSIVDAFSSCKCKCKPGTHAQAAGSNTADTAFYPELMCEKIARALYPMRVCQQVPSCPVVPLSVDPQHHREKEQDLKHVSALASEAIAVAVESDESKVDIEKEVTEIMDLNGLMSDILGIPKGKPCAEVNAAVTKLLSRAEMLSSPEALQAVKAEADGLVAKGTWDLSSVREQDDVRSEAKATGTSVHFGQLMTIASIKFHELAKHLQKVKGRIVYRGDAAKDELGFAAVYQELGANPTSVQGLNATLAYGSIPGNGLSAADAVKAYVQAFLKSKHPTWIQLRPSWWREKFAKPVVLLVKALYGHPEAGGHWERHLKGIIKRLGGEEIPEFPGNFFFPDTRLMLSTYVDDLTLAGPKESHAPFWKALCGMVDVEPPEPIHRILGRDHLFAKLPDPLLPNEVESAAMRAIDLGMVFDMKAYTAQTIDLYKECAKVSSVKPALTPFVADGSLNPDEDEVTGTLAPVACKVLMKALWLARLARPDILKPIGDLASNVQKWSRNHDRQLLRLIQYLVGTCNHRLVGTVQDAADDLELVLYVDADFCGERAHTKSTSGGYLVLYGPQTWFPLAWVSKRQTSTSRSTTEAEVISLAHSLYAEGLPSLQLWERLLGRPVKLRVKEDNQATIKVVKKGFSPKLRHIQRTHKVNLGCLQEIFDEDESSVLEYVETDKQAADIFTKGLVPAKWPNALALLGIRELPEEIKTTKVAIPGLGDN